MAAKRRYLEEFGEQIARNGYEVIPIVPGEKRPAGDDWQKMPAGPPAVRAQVRKGRGGHGVGIRTRNAGAVDIDCYDPEIVEAMRKFCFDLVGPTMSRVGQPPKLLLAYQTPEPFPKTDSGFFTDPDDRNVKCEILADGQQYVAAHIHPDTKKPYVWIDGSPLKTKLDDLPVLTHEMADQIRNEFRRLMALRGWPRKRGSVERLPEKTDGSTPVKREYTEDVFASAAAKTDISDEELRRKLMLVPGSEDHDMWFHVGMALYHQYDGTQQGLDLWHDWSADAHNYDSDALDKRWPTFNIEQKGRAPITARFIIKQAQDEEVRVRVEELQRIRVNLSQVPEGGIEKLTAICDEIKGIAFSNPIREMLTGLVKDTFKRVTKTAPRIGAIRDMIRYENPENRKMPNWLKDFVYVQFEKAYYHTTSRRVLDRESFDASHARLLMTKKDVLEGRSSPEHAASFVALNQYQIPLAYLRMYLPGMDELFSIENIDYVNTYSPNTVPELPGTLSRNERDAVNTVLHHFEHLIRDPSDRAMLMDFIAFIVQNPGRRINWAILLQGAEGDGKTFFAQLLQAMIGLSNVNTIRGNALEEKYNSWAEGAQVCFIEDVRLHGSNRFDAINTLKPLISNATVAIRRMNVNIYSVVNTMSYIMTSNMKDALPAGRDDSRYYPIFSRFQTKTAIDAFKFDNPDYYTELFGALVHGGALRQHFMAHRISDRFDPLARAPESRNRQEMISLNMSDEEEALHDSLIESSRLDYSPFLLNASHMAEEFMGRDAIAPATKALGRLLSTAGFTLLGRFKIDGDKHRFWTRNPEAWPTDEAGISQAIRDYLDPTIL